MRAMLFLCTHIVFLTCEGAFAEKAAFLSSFLVLTYKSGAFIYLCTLIV